MKKIYLLIFVLCASTFLNAQNSISVTNNSTGAMLSNSTTVYVSTTVGGLPDEADFIIKNTSSGSLNYLVRRIDVLLHKVSASDSAEAYFCFGTACFPATTTITPTAVSIGSNGTLSLKTYLQEASVVGLSTVKYQVYNAANMSDAFTFTVMYNSPLSVKENVDLFTVSSTIYPNPVNHVANIKIQASSNIKNTTVSLVNTLGTVVYSNTSDLTLGENIIRIDTDNFPSGIYFATIASGKTQSVKKFIINK